MSEFMRDALPIIFMFGCVLALGPFIAIAMWMAFDGDRLREEEVATEAAAAPTGAAIELVASEPAPTTVTAGATSAA
jgi:hypothetical protein